ncbi:hypothetical protein POTOM_024763 [Populus tomentosa]|uniref:Glycosyltransferase family 92 protein n=1 Tax=Populus tomentosa TaxID=118781 RepID=A0A8X8CWS6_POPTO|nr:hypothetical protein POTOM_024763 [Populus tomentosa]
MAGLRPPTSISQTSTQLVTSLLVLLLTLLPLALAGFAFVLQCRGGLTDPTTRWSHDHHEFPVMETISGLTKDVVRNSDLLGQRHSLSFPYFRDWKFGFGSDLKPKNLDIWKNAESNNVSFMSDVEDINTHGFCNFALHQICITTSTSAGLEQTLPWIFYHKVMGVSTFFLFVEGKAASHDVSKVLETVPGVKVICRLKELEEQQAKGWIWNETWLSSFFYKPCNFELFVKQSLNMEMAIVMAREASMDWIIHLETDELIHPAGASEYFLRQLLSDVPGNVDMVIFPNYESSVERDDIKEPFSEVSMLKKNHNHLPKDKYFGNYEEATRGNPNYFLTCGNGKSAARIRDHLCPNGTHRWHNYMKTPNKVKLEEAAVLHYTYPKFSDLTSRRDPCGCKPMKEDVKRCFMFMAAFIIASMATEEEMLHWYQERIMWTDEALKLKLLRKGILTRIYTPMVIVHRLRESGVFSSVIAAAQKFISSVKTSNYSMTAGVVSSRKIGHGGESQATARRGLQVSDDASIFSAIPPVSS